MNLASPLLKKVLNTFTIQWAHGDQIMEIVVFNALVQQVVEFDMSVVRDLKHVTG